MSYMDGSLRIVVHTGNLIESDWEDRTQGLWISPLCLPLPPRDTTNDSGDDAIEGDSEVGFKRDLLRYLDSYSLPELEPWIQKIRRCDMSGIKYEPSISYSLNLPIFNTSC